MRLSASNLVRALELLPKDQWFEYVNKKTKTKVRVLSVKSQEGPIYIERRGEKATEKVPISSVMLWRLANAMQPNIPVNVDRVFAGSYNTRSALETLLAHSPEFYWCTPGRIQLENSTQNIKKGHKHLVWRPETPH